ncbi:MAG: sensor histidine kinase, partial [Thermoguttaceae bacterium]
NPQSPIPNPQMMSSPDLDALAEFAAGAGHEINNPLAIISGHAQLLLSQIQDPQQRQSLAIIAAQVRRAHEMIADIRLFARPPQPEWARVELVRFLRNWLEEKALELREKQIVLEFVANEEELELTTDATQLTVVLSALLKNAVESLDSYSGTINSADPDLELPQSGQLGRSSLPSTDKRVRRITFSLERRGDHCDLQRPSSDQPGLNRAMLEEGTTTGQELGPGQVILSITDNGPGIPLEIRPLIFSPYFSGRSAGRGLGFGLSKAWRIAQQLGATLELDEAYTTGTRMKIIWESTLV